MRSDAAGAPGPTVQSFFLVAAVLPFCAGRAAGLAEDLAADRAAARAGALVAALLLGAAALAAGAPRPEG